MSQPMPVAKEVMVLGSVPEAGWVAQELLALGYAVHWASSDETPLDSALSHPRLARYAGYRLVKLEGHVGSFATHLQRDGQACTVPAAAVVVATGNARYYPVDRYQQPLSSRVLTVAQMRCRLAAPQPEGATLPHPHERVLVMLDLGGETAKETATEALNLALALRAEGRSEVYVFYQNLKVDTYGLEQLTRAMRERGVIFCRYAQPQISVDDAGVSVTYVEGTLRGEWLVLPEAVRPREDTGALAALLRVRVGEDGFFQDINIRQYRPGLAARKGIFFAGRCHMDASLSEAQADAAHAAANVDALLGTGILEPEAVLAHVEATKCIRCLTCVRTCPHAAVELAEYEDGVAARVVDAACFGCGACVANCPVRAIELTGQAVPAWMQTP